MRKLVPRHKAGKQHSFPCLLEVTALFPQGIVFHLKLSPAPPTFPPPGWAGNPGWTITWPQLGVCLNSPHSPRPPPGSIDILCTMDFFFLY